MKHVCGSGAKEWRLPGEKGADEVLGGGRGLPAMCFHCHSEPVIYPVGNGKASLAWFLIREIA